MSSSSDSFSPWSSLKSLSSLVESAVLHKSPGLRPELEAALRRHKPSFIALLKNPPRNPGDADLVRKAQSEGISLAADGADSVPGRGQQQLVQLQKLPPQVVEEALILSEMFNLNEIAALQLLLKGAPGIWTINMKQ